MQLYAQLIHVIRYASRSGTAKRVEDDVFWFKRPRLLLHPIRMVRSRLLTLHRPTDAHSSGSEAASQCVQALFLCSFQWCWPVFLLWQFGFNSCFFKDMTWQTRSTAVPFWVSM